MSKKSHKSGEVAFDQFYESHFGERWQTLKKALLTPKSHIMIHNPHGKFNSDGLELFANCPFLFNVKGEYPKPEITPFPYYFIDGASAYAPLSLEIEEGEEVLDLCAAPGGKSLIMALLLKGTGRLVANDKSENRRFRLLDVIRNYIPEEVIADHIKVTGHDATKWCLYEKEAFDKILLDAPCSSEKHVLAAPHELKQWRLGRTKRLAMNQWTMLASAWLVLKPGGRIVYSTCSISPLENDDVVKKLINKFGDEADVLFPQIKGGEQSEFGTWLLPDQSGHGPFYLAVIDKLPR